MSRNPDWYLIGVLGAIVGMVITAVIAFSTDAGPPEQHFFQNVCKWERGVVKDDLCIKGNTVIGKERGYQFVDFKEVP